MAIAKKQTGEEDADGSDESDVNMTSWKAASRARKKIKQMLASNTNSIDTGLSSDENKVTEKGHSKTEKLKKEQSSKKRAVAETQEANPLQHEFTVSVCGTGNLEERRLRRRFAKCGEIQHMHMLANDDGFVEGTAFVTYTTQEAVDEALKYNGAEIAGGIVKVELGASSKKSKKEGEKNKAKLVAHDDAANIEENEKLKSKKKKHCVDEDEESAVDDEDNDVKEVKKSKKKKSSVDDDLLNDKKAKKRHRNEDC